MSALARDAVKDAEAVGAGSGVHAAGPIRPVPMADQYDAYMQSGAYDSRYPAANPRVLSVVGQMVARLAPGQAVVDYGCGNGRYLVPAAQRHPGPVFGCDISGEALGMLSERLAGLSLERRVTLIHGDIDRLLGREAPPVGLAMMLFGVLSHIQGRDERLRTLDGLRAMADGPRARLLVSVPNRWRRFRACGTRQRAETGDDVLYSRVIDGAERQFYYHLYTKAGLVADLNRAGWRVTRIQAESVAPESAISHLQAARRGGGSRAWASKLALGLDGLAADALPADVGYGFLAVARPR